MPGKVADSILRGAREALQYAKGDVNGYVVHHVHVPETVDVKAIRKCLDMTQKEFAATFGFSLDAVRHWETGRRRPEKSARILLKVIEKMPEAVLAATAV